MDKIYRVFISSTYEDLIEERKEVTQALLEMNCFPTGMELFQASNDTQWDLIKKLIDSCDYYIVIIAGRYGSIHGETKKSYTQMEYEYALSAGIPVLGFIRRDLSKLPHDKVDNLMSVKRFIKIVKQKEVKYWSTPHELAGVVSRAMHHAMEDYPRIGWVRDSNKSYDVDIMDAVRRVLFDRHSVSYNALNDHISQAEIQEKTEVTSSQAHQQPRYVQSLKDDGKEFSGLDEDSRCIKYFDTFLLDQKKTSALKEISNIVLSSGATAISDMFDRYVSAGSASFSFFETSALLGLV